MTPDSMVCSYCGKDAPLVSGIIIYPHRPDLYHRQFYYCASCAAWVGCHAGTTTPLGRLANGELRQAKMRVHDAFDRLWKSGAMRRSLAYQRLAAAMGMPARACHIGEFDVAQCQQALDAIAAMTAQKVTTHD